MKIKINFKRMIATSLLIAFVAAMLSDFFYGRTMIANRYLIGQFINQIFHWAMAFALIFFLLWLILKMMSSDFFYKTLNSHPRPSPVKPPKYKISRSYKK